MAEPRRDVGEAPPPATQPGVGRVLVVAAAVVLVVALAVVVTELIPGLTTVVYQTPVAIGVLIAGTALVFWRITRDRG